MAGPVKEVVGGDGYAVGHIDAMGDRYGFRKIRRELGVTAFGINAVCMPPGYEAGRHYHDEQEETYFVHQGTIEMEFGDGTAHRSGPAGLRGSTRARSAWFATSATATPSTSAPAGRTGTSAATVACPRTKSARASRARPERPSGRSE